MRVSTCCCCAPHWICVAKNKIYFASVSTKWSAQNRYLKAVYAWWVPNHFAQRTKFVENILLCEICVGRNSAKKANNNELNGITLNFRLLSMRIWTFTGVSGSKTTCSALFEYCNTSHIIRIPSAFQFPSGKRKKKVGVDEERKNQNKQNVNCLETFYANRYAPRVISASSSLKQWNAIINT